MKHSLYSILVGIFLSSHVLNVQAADCTAPNFNAATAQLNMACVTLGQENYELTLDFMFNPPVGGNPSSYFWKLGDAKLSSCDPTPTTCATLEESLDLVIPLGNIIENRQIAVILRAYNAGQSNRFFWELNEPRLFDPANMVSLRRGTPNPNGSFEALYLIDGQFAANFGAQLNDVILLEDGLTLPQSSLTSGQNMNLRIYHINDIHSTLTDRVGNAERETHYMAQMVKIVKDAKAAAAENEAILFVSAGDDHVGSPFDELLGRSADTFIMSAPYRAFSGAGIDATVLGNHEPDYGTELLARAIRQDADFPVLSANLFGSEHLTTDDYHPALIGIVKGLRVGIIGVQTDLETYLKTERDPALDIADYIETVERVMPYIEPLADVIMILSHVGYNGEVNVPIRHILERGDVDIATAAANLTSKPVVVVGGHSHVQLNETQLEQIHDGVPVVHAGAYGQYLGQLDLSLNQTDFGLFAEAAARLIATKVRDERERTTSQPDYDPANFEQPADIDAEFEQSVMQPIYAQLTERLSQVLGTAGDVSELATETTIANRYIGEVAIANFMNDAIAARSVNFPNAGGTAADLTIFNATGISAGVMPSEPITFGDWFEVMPFVDTIVQMEMTGQQIKDMVMSNAKRLVRPNELQANGGILDPAGFISRGFLHFSSNLRYTIKLGANYADMTAQDILLNGQPIDSVLEQTFNVICNSYIGTLGRESWQGQDELTIQNGVTGETETIAITPFDMTSITQNDTFLVYRNENISYITENANGRVDGSTGAVLDGRLTVVE